MNTNCLVGMRCPKCGCEDEILVRAEMWVSLQDDGTDPFSDSLKMLGDVAYDGDSDAACPECGHEGKLGEWERERMTPSRKTGDHAVERTIALVVVERGMAEVYQPLHADVRVVDVDSIRAGDPRPVLPGAFAKLVADAGVEEYVEVEDLK